MSDWLILLGASVRAAAASAVRAGFRPAGGDLFADADLAALGPALRTDVWPGGLAELSRQLPPGPWLMTGGLEHHSDLVDEIARERGLLGNPGHVLRAVRDPLCLAAALEAARLDVPECRVSARGLPCDGSWLRKRTGSSAGLGVEPWTGQGSDEPADAYFQRRILGQPCAALFVAARGRAVLLGVSEQLLGPSFFYRGSIGPVMLTFAQRETWQRIGMALADRFELEGLFGVDAIVDALGHVWPVEVNPRCTASVEVLERAFGIATLGWHVTACRDGRLPELPQPNVSTSCGKRIVLAAADVCISAEQSARWLASSQGQSWPCLADIPPGGTQVRQGQPLLSLLAEGTDPAAVADELARREQSLLAELTETCTANELNRRRPSCSRNRQ